MAEEKMSDGEIRYRFKTIDRRFEEIDKRFDDKDRRGDRSWTRVLAIIGIAATLVAALIGVYATTKGIK